MTILKVYEYPDPILRASAAEVTEFGDEFQQQVDDTIATLYAHEGAVGLAATQVGLLLRFFAMDLHPNQPESNLQIFVNPEIIQSSRWKMAREGCLSFPDYLANVKRAKRLTVAACDRHGKPFERELEGFEAIVVQHELDHLDGIVFIDRVRSISSDIRLRTPDAPPPETLLDPH
ncbi:MAG: peptide deformylase [Cyanobacteria bacterium P01_D01_bin.123]